MFHKNGGASKHSAKDDADNEGAGHGSKRSPDDKHASIHFKDIDSKFMSCLNGYNIKNMDTLRQRIETNLEKH